MISMRGIVSQIQMYILARLQRKFKRMTIMRRRRGRASRRNLIDKEDHYDRQLGFKGN